MNLRNRLDLAPAYRQTGRDGFWLCINGLDK